MAPPPDPRARVLEAASSLVSLRGFQALDLATVAAAAGMEEREVRRLCGEPKELARTLMRSALARDDWDLDTALARGRDLAADPLGAALASLSLMASALREQPARLPGWRLAAICLAEHAVDDPVLRDLARIGSRRARARFCQLFADIAATRQARVPLEAAAFAELAVAALEAAAGPDAKESMAEILSDRILVLRGCLKALFDSVPGADAAPPQPGKSR